MNERPRFSGPVPRPGGRYLEEREPTNAELAGRLELGLSELGERMDRSIVASEERLGERIGVVHDEVALLRQTVHGDHAKRITATEERTRSIVPPAAARAGKYVGVASIYPIVEALWSMVQKWIQSR